MEIKTKYSIHDKVWFMFNNKPISGNISGVLFIKSINVCSWSSKLKYCVQTHLKQENELDEEQLFETKESLLKYLNNYEYNI